MAEEFKQNDAALANLCTGTLGKAFNSAAPKSDPGWAACVDLDLGAALEDLHASAPQATKVVPTTGSFMRQG